MSRKHHQSLSSTIMESVRREGLTMIHSPPGAELDLIIIHGLNGSPYRTFCHERTGFFWPKELAKTLPKARIMVFGYVADIFNGSTNTLGVYQHAESLLLHLKNNRVSASQEKRPIVFIGHSLGGIVIKQAIILSSHRPLDASILQSTKLIVFLGTPHRGSHVLDSSLAKTGLSFMKLANREIPKNVRTMLQPRGDESFIINTDFIRAKGQIEIVNFYEQVTRAHLQDLVVDKDSAVLDSERSENIPVARDHEHLVRFEDAEDDAYHTLRQTIRRKVTKILENMSEREKTGQKDNLLRACRLSLGELAPSTTLARPKEAHRKTLSWLWDADSELFSWIKSGSGLFAVTGKPGSGKSVLMNEVATRMRKRHRHQFGVIVQYAFNARGAPSEHSFDGFLRFALSQILRHCPSSFDAVLDEWAYLAHDSGVHPTETGISSPDDASTVPWPISSLKTALLSAVSHAAREAPICLIVDALDECDGGVESVHDLIAFFMATANATPSTSEGGLRICFSCRDLPSHIGDAIAGGFRMEQRNEPDIVAYINDRWSTLESIVEPGIKLKQLKADLVKKADGIFLWAHLALERIQTALREGATVVELQETVDDIPEELGGLFALLLGNINPKYATETNVMLAIALSTERPLTLTEFRYATALATCGGVLSHAELEQCAGFVSDDGTMRKRIRSRCGGLLEMKTMNEVTEGMDDSGANPREVVQFIHQSVRDSLLLGSNTRVSDGQGLRKESSISEGHEMLARCCIQYLSTQEARDVASRVRPHSRNDKSWRQSIRRELPFLNYAVEFCFHHCQQAENSGISHAQLLGRVFTPDEESFSHYVALRNALHQGESYSPGLTILQLAVEYDLASYVEMRFNQDAADVDAVLDGGDNYVQLAVRKENVKTLKVLLSHGADVNLSHLSYLPIGHELFESMQHKHVRPLIVACRKGNTELVRLLLEHGADLSSCDYYRDGVYTNQALVSAAYSGNIEVVRQLLGSDHGSLAHPEVRLNVIEWLSYTSHRLETEMRRKEGVFRGSKTEWDSEKMRQISDLILSDIDVHQPGFDVRSAARMWYDTGCRKDVLRRLIDIGTDISGYEDISFLRAACVRGNVASVQLLLENGVDPHITYGPFERSHLHDAVWARHPAVLSYLLQQGLDVNLADNKGATPLHLAAAYGADEFIHMLLDYKADIAVCDSTGRRPFWYATLNRQLKNPVSVLERLLCEDSDVHAKDVLDATPLHIAAHSALLPATRWLLSKGANPAVLNSWGRTALHAAASSPCVDSTDVLEMLLDHKPQTGAPRVDINAPDGADMTAMHHIFWILDPQIPDCNFDPGVAIANAKLLLRRGANLAATDNAGNTPLHWAALRGIKELVWVFLREGADPNACDVNGLRPLDLAELEDVREMLEEAMARN
ncbi:hypothetical protein QBC34DRAFT_401310 [Podospora aff. communis PSN243]|uniref:GPI inositol-deacylase n=1 Tax=Podospora aff. communis PSN243 TaxID=3040156 RepID=A0AAV9GU80_9PEZI|nr:hypothetical protein QBC34DRAFT_401310 [Podospora aff. communis PSN243]